MCDRLRFVLLAALAAGLSTVGFQPAIAQEKKAADEAASREIIENLLKRVENLEKQLAKLKGGAKIVPADKKDQKIIPLLESMYYGPTYYSSSGPRFFVAKLILVNLTAQNVTLKKTDLQLKIGNKSHKMADLPSNLRGASFYIGTQSHTLSTIKPAEHLLVKPGGTASTWIVFTGMPTGNDVPKMELQIKFGEKTTSLDVGAFALGRLALKSERIGPRGSLGLLTVSGGLNTVNAGGLVEAIDALVKQKVVRVVIRWTNSAPAMNSRLQEWLQQSANNAGRSNTSSSNYPFPAIPATIRELHLAQMPKSTSYGSSGLQRIHKTDAEAVSAALRSAYEILPRDELVKEIEEGHPLTRAAALAGGGGRLPADRLPLILKYADDNDAKLQLAAMSALQHFGDKAAIAKLSHYARKNTAILGEEAIASLAASRFASAHTELLSILKNEPPKSKKKIVIILAAHPRPIWSETIYDFVKDPNSDIGTEALKALGQIGHPKLIEVLESSLKSRDSAMRTEAFRQLIQRKDVRSEEIALEYSLIHMKNSPPESQMYQLLQRTKDQRAVPLLLAHLDKDVDKNSSNTSLIDTLALIGDQTVGKQLADRYPKMKSDYMKASVLRALVKLKSPQFRPLAGQALMTKNSSLVSAACDGLRTDAGQEAVRLLADALEQSTYSSAWSYTTNSLATIGTPEARRALIRARDSDNTSKRSYAISALRNLMQRSPGYQYVYRAKESLRQNKPKDALEHYTLALKLDDDLSAALAGRGHIYLQLNKPADARKDFDAALKIDPDDIEAITGSAILLARDGKFQEAVTKAEALRKDNAGNRIFLYNAARVYGRAITALNNTKATPDRDKTIAAYQKKAIVDIQEAIKRSRNFSDGYKPTHVKDEADFAALRKLPDFQKIISQTGKKTGKAAGKEAAPGGRIRKSEAKTAVKTEG